ncbi:MAG TPA: 2-hydroxyacid dehydrogenase [Usitatibacteraceae bacterium]
MKPRILQNGRLMPALETALAGEFDLHPLWREADPKAYLAQHGGEFVGLATSARVGADAALIAALPALKVIGNFGVGYDTIDIDAAKNRGIAVSNTPDVLTDCVADLAFGLLIDVARGLSASDRFLRRGDWLRGAFPLQTRVSGKRLGIVGLGRIGRTIAKRASGFDMDVHYHNRRPAADTPFVYERSLIELARWADFLVVASAGGPETRHLISAEVIAALGADGFLINIARGTVVDEQALVDALVNKRIAGAALDVFEKEPHVPEALLGLDNAVLMPHIASGTHETRQAMADLTLANLRSFFRDGRLLTPIA